MHISEGLLPVAHASAWAGVAAVWVALCARTERQATSPRRALVTLAGALTFAATMLPIPIPGLGITSHICATPAFALLLGARALALPVVIVLAVQAAFLAHGGLTTLGANVVTLGVVGPLVALGVARALRAASVPAGPATFVACATGSLAVYGAAATILAVGLPRGGTFLGDLTSLLAALAPVQLPLSIVEGALSAALLRALALRRPGLLPAWLDELGPPSSPTALGAPSAPTALGALLVALLLAAPAGAQEPPRFEGVDEAVFERAADAVGAGGRAPLLLSGEGELNAAALILTSFMAGVIATRAWAALGAHGGPGAAPHAP